MNDRTALVATFIVLFALLGIFGFVWPNIEIQQSKAEDFLLFASILIISLISVNVYQALRISESASKLASGMAEKMLSTSQELFSQTYRLSPVPYVLIDRSGVVESANTSAIRLFKVREGELNGKNMFDLIEGDDEVSTSLFIEKFRKGLTVNNKDVQIIRSDGTKRWVLLSVFPYRSKEGKAGGLMTLVDVTKQKEIDRAKSEFVSLASHQLRTPIAAMKWNLELLFTRYAKDLDNPILENLQKVNENLVRMDHLVADFLSSSRFELGTLTAHYTNVDMVSFFNDLFDEHRGQIEKKKLDVDLQLSKNAEEMTTDPNLIRMIIGNLVSNAIKYTPEGGKVSVIVSTEANAIRITVTDTGIGIPEDEQDQLFSKIFRASNAQATIPDGTGLGLYVASEAAKVLRGSLKFSSEENIGSTFTVELPV